MFQLRIYSLERSVKFVYSDSIFNPKHFKNFTMTLVNGTLNMDMTLLRPIQRGFKAHVDYQLKLKNAKNFQSILSHLIDICSVVDNIKDGLFKNWFKSMLKHGNFKLNCPVDVGTYYLRNWRMGTSHKFLYPGEYSGKINFFYGKYKTKTEEHVLSVTLASVISG
ncbi:uncharacterized protein LOC108598031 [Drosophila busckii]|uniref:uncharacterized protein LOC108598031 n=1 Tax=Drosophila busckii TaxID=30019 RepID=UPI00083F2AB3|nr:uncharacterized protein LOC108598031 [Drosophila busckii]